MNKRTIIAYLLITGVIAAPVVVYLSIFGATVSSDHNRWAEFGSAIGGIYSPIVALFTLIVLLRQVTLQSQMNTLQLQMNIHEYDQAYLQQARENIEFYCGQMAQTMNSPALPGQSLREVLHKDFSRPSIGDLDSERLRQLAANLHSIIPRLYDIWDAIYPIFVGLETGKAPMYGMTRASSIQKLIALLSFETCVALDNFHRVRTEGRIQLKYVYSSLLETNQS